MSGTFPSSPAPRRVTVTSIQPTRVSVAHSLKRQVRTNNAQRWALKLEFPPMERDDFAPIWAFVVAQRGQWDAFQYVLPRPLYTPRGAGAVGSPSPYVDNTTTSPTEEQVGRSIITRGWQPSTTVLKAGDWFKFGSHTKVYIAREDIASSAAGLATLLMEPAAVMALPQGDQIITNSVPFTVSLGRDDNEFSLDIAPVFGVSLELMEAY